jgi:hypothetical protein
MVWGGAEPDVVRSLSIKRTKYRLIIKVIIRMTENRETNPLRLINLLLEFVYCRTTLSNHDIIRFVISLSKIERGYVMSFVINPYLIFLISAKGSLD